MFFRIRFFVAEKNHKKIKMDNKEMDRLGLSQEARDDFRKADEEYAERIHQLKLKYGLEENLNDANPEEAEEEEVLEYYTCYSVQVFSKVAGADFAKFDGVYIQTHGGGPEGGYLFSGDGNLYSVKREWFKPFQMIYMTKIKSNEARLVSNDNNPDQIRFLRYSEEEPLQEETYLDVEERFQDLWQEAQLNYLSAKEDKEEEKCVLCDSVLETFGNNPAPLAESGKCCDNCNETKVMSARIATIIEERESVLQDNSPHSSAGLDEVEDDNAYEYSEAEDSPQETFRPQIYDFR